MTLPHLHECYSHITAEELRHIEAIHDADEIDELLAHPSWWNATVAAIRYPDVLPKIDISTRPLRSDGYVAAAVRGELRKLRGAPDVRLGLIAAARALGRFADRELATIDLVDVLTTEGVRAGMAADDARQIIKHHLVGGHADAR